MIEYKGFDKDLKCREFQYEVGKEYTQEGNIECCSNGFHCCKNPFDVLNYYPLIDNNGNMNRFCEVEGSGAKSSNKDKNCYEKLHIKAEIGIKGLISAMVDYVKEKVKDNDSSGYYAKIGSSGYYAKIGSSGYSAQIGSSGYSAQIGSSGYYAKIGSSGYSAKIGSSGDYTQIGSSGDSAQIGNSGDYAQIGSSGYSAKIGSSGDYTQISSEGENSVICCAGNECKAKAKVGSWITLSEWEYNKEKQRYIPICVKTGYVDGEKIKADTWYMLKDGEFIEVGE